MPAPNYLQRTPSASISRVTTVTARDTIPAAKSQYLDSHIEQRRCAAMLLKSLALGAIGLFLV